MVELSFIRPNIDLESEIEPLRRAVRLFSGAKCEPCMRTQQNPEFWVFDAVRTRGNTEAAG